MIIRSTSAKNLHGHLNIDQKFNPGINILIGVNGSGKTSLLNAIAWTLSPGSVQGGLPTAYLLTKLRFDEINIAFTVPGRRKYHRLKATRTDQVVAIAVEGIDETLKIPVLDMPASPPFRRTAPNDERSDFIVRFLDDQRNNQVLRFLADLAGPLYLPLDRRWTGEREQSQFSHRWRSTTAGHLPASQIVDLAERAYRNEQHRTSRLTQKLRNDVLTSLFEVDFEVDRELHSHVWSLSEFMSRRDRVEKALTHLGLSDARTIANKYFTGLEEVVEKVGGRTMPVDWQQDPQSAIWIEWIINMSAHAFRIERLIPLIEKYDSDRILINRRSTAFLESVNYFFRENGKILNFSNNLELTVDLPNGQQISTQELASGELQLIILFTFLYYQFETQDQEFPVLVDEPELSLHVAWQNRYVESIASINPEAQFIIATHSPEIAAGQPDEAILDISPPLPA